MSATLDMTGQKFGKLTAICRSRISKWGHWYWKFLCDCGKEFESSGYRVHIGQVKSCGCTRRNKRTPNSILKSVYRDYQLRATEKALAFDFSFEDFMKITSLPCEYCGRLPEARDRRGAVVMNSIDR